MTEKSRKVNESQTDFLKPCPFCGGEVEIHRYGGSMQYFIMCKDCWLKVEDGFAPTRMPKEALMGFYNRRVRE